MGSHGAHASHEKNPACFAIAATCGAIAFPYFYPDFSLMADASSGENGPIADMDQPLPHTVLAGGTEPVQTGHAHAFD